MIGTGSNGYGIGLVPALAKAAPPPAPPVDPVNLPYIFETPTLDGYSLTFNSATGAGFVRVGAIKTSASSNLSATLDGVAWPPVAIQEEPGAAGAVVAIFAAKGESVGSHTVVFSGNVSKAAGRFGDVLDYSSIKQSKGDVWPSVPFWGNQISGVLTTSDITMLAASVVAAASPISGDGIAQGQSFVTPLSVWFSHDPPPNAAIANYVSRPKVAAPGVMLSVEVNLLKPILPDIEKVESVSSANFTRLPNGNYRIYAYYDSSIRFFWPVGQLLGGHDYTLSFDVVSASGDVAVADWCDGTDGGASTVPVGTVALGVGHVEFTVSRPTYTNTYHFLDISNGEDEESGNDMFIEITPPILHG